MKHVVVNATVIADVETHGDLAIIAVSGSSYYYSSVAAWDAVAVDATMVAITAVSGSSCYYSSAAVWDAVVVDATVDANPLVWRGGVKPPAVFCSQSYFSFSYIYIITHLLLIRSGERYGKTSSTTINTI